MVAPQGGGGRRGRAPGGWFCHCIATEHDAEEDERPHAPTQGPIGVLEIHRHLRWPRPLVKGAILTDAWRWGEKLRSAGGRGWWRAGRGGTVARLDTQFTTGTSTRAGKGQHGHPRSLVPAPQPCGRGVTMEVNSMRCPSGATRLNMATPSVLAPTTPPLPAPIRKPERYWYLPASVILTMRSRQGSGFHPRAWLRMSASPAGRREEMTEVGSILFWTGNGSIEVLL
jgi:hypothetical protein